MRLNWLSYFDPRKDYKTVWWRDGDLTGTRMTTPCGDRGTPRMNCPFKGHFIYLLRWSANDPKQTTKYSKTDGVDVNLKIFIGLTIPLKPRFYGLKIYRSNRSFSLANFIYENSNWRLPPPFRVDLIAQTLINSAGYVVIICIT